MSSLFTASQIQLTDVANQVIDGNNFTYSGHMLEKMSSNLSIKLSKSMAVLGFFALGACSGTMDLFPDDLFSGETMEQEVDIEAELIENPPSFKIGDSFSFNNPDMTWSVTAIHDDKVDWRNESGDIQTTAKNPLLPALTWKSERRGEGRRIISEMEGHFFPLEVGNQVIFKTTVNTNKPPYAWEFDWTCDFVSQEIITVPAGVFNTYRIDCYRQKPELWSFYYAPSVGYYVKMESNNAASPGDIKKRELVHFFHGDMSENPMMVSSSTPSEEMGPTMMPAVAPTVETMSVAPIMPAPEVISTAPVSQIAQTPSSSAVIPSFTGYGAHVESYKKASNVAPAWERLVTNYPNQLAGFQKIVRRVDLGSKGVFDRLIIGPFDSKKSATDFCKTLKVQGQKYCQALKL